MDAELLKKKIDESGYKLKYVAKQLNLSYPGFLAKLKNETEFKASEIKTLYELLNLSEKERDEIFFYPNSGFKIHDKVG